jgi:glycosyltransferase involved in cell wall biosynthesis
MLATPPPMTRVALLSSEPIRARMAGVGIRYLELARRLPRPGLEAVLLSPAEPAEAPTSFGGVTIVRRAERGRLRQLLSDCDVAVAQGDLANDLVLEVPELPAVVDLCDPWLIENLHYAPALGLGPYRHDHASWVLQMSRGDFFLCSSEEQRQFYLGFLAALGRVNPARIADDADLSRLIAAVPFGVPRELPAYRPLLPPGGSGEKRLLFGGLYDWYDPWPLLTLIEHAPEPGWRVLFVRNPNLATTPQRLFGEVEAWCRERGLWGRRVEALDWVPSERRWDLLRDVDVLVAPHRPGVETLLSFRTRFVEALAVGCPVVTTEGGTVSRMLRDAGAGWVVPAGDVGALRAALTTALGDVVERRVRGERGRELSRRFEWDSVLDPLVRFCTAPCRDVSKDVFVQSPPTRTPGQRLTSRLRRWCGRLRGAATTRPGSRGAVRQTWRDRPP